jgi:hypothetical protein
MQIQKMGQWHGAKEYIREELACYSAGMSMSMEKSFNIVNIARNAYNNITTSVMEIEYKTAFAMAA